jgi:hypothetical protein
LFSRDRAPTTGWSGSALKNNKDNKGDKSHFGIDDNRLLGTWTYLFYKAIIRRLLKYPETYVEHLEQTISSLNLQTTILLMTENDKLAVERQIAAHAAAESEGIARLRTLSMRERGRMLKAACEAAAQIQASRLAAGLPPVQREPWPESTWEFLRKHAARFRK